MKKLNIVKALHKAVHPIVAITAIIGVVLLIGASPFITRALSRFNFSSTKPPKSTSVHVISFPTITAHTVPISALTPSFAPTPTLAPGQKAIYTFYIQASSHTTSGKGLGLQQADTGKMFTIDTGTFISLDFGPGKFEVSLSSPQDIFKCIGSECLPHSSPENSISSFWVSHAGYGTITVIEVE